MKKLLALLMALAMVFATLSFAAAEGWDLANIPDQAEFQTMFVFPLIHRIPLIFRKKMPSPPQRSILRRRRGWKSSWRPSAMTSTRWRPSAGRS